MQRRVTARSLSRACGAYVASGGLLSLAGWFFDYPRLTDWNDVGISIQPNACVAAIGAGLALLCVSVRRRRLAAVLGVVPLAIGAAALIEWASGATFAFNTILMFDRPWGRGGTVALGRMGPPGSVSWTLIGIALLLAARPPRARRAVPAIGLTVIGISALSLTGYLFGADLLYTLPRLTTIALQTATFVAVAGIGVVASEPSHEPLRTLLADSSAATMARRTLPAALLAPFLLGLLRLEGQRLGFYDTAMGVALLVLVLIVVICAVLWRGARAVTLREVALAATQQSLRDTQRRLSAFLEQLPVGAGLVDASGHVTLSNAVWRRYFGDLIPSKDPAQRERWQAWDINGAPLPPSCWPGTRALNGELVQPGIDFLFTGPDNASVWVRVAATPFRDGTDAIVGAIIVAEDIDSQKRAIDRRMAAEAQLRLVADTVPVMIAHYDLYSRCSFLNKAYATALRSNVESRVGQHMRDIVGDEAFALCAPHIQQVLDGHIVEFDADMAVGDDDLWFVHIIYAPERDTRGHTVGFVEARTNITERRVAEAALREADHRKDEFLATLAHELRNPLAPMRTSVELLKRSRDQPALLDAARATLERQVAHMVRLIDDLLDISRITQNKISLRKEPIDLASPIRSALETARPMFEAARQVIEISLPAAPLMVDADAVRLSQVFSNLLTNASKYTPSGGRITVAVEAARPEAVVRIVDTGGGIPEDMLQAVFEPFTQLDRSLDRARGGLGIGLSLVRRLVELHGGTVQARGAGLGLGSEFIVCLPLTATAVAEASDRAPEPAMDIDGRRVLVVDDNEDAATSLQTFLQLSGAVVWVAHDGPAALQIAAAVHPDAIVLDIGLPGPSGFEVCRSIRRESWGHAVVLIALSGWGQQDIRCRSEEAGFTAHLVKPVDHDVLLNLIAAPVVNP